jgi:AcrR family transcriptional regulator
LKEIAQEAGVGIGTLYRHFPTRAVLVEATYRSESARLSAAATDLLREYPPAEALRIWMERFLDYMAVKRGMAEALRYVLSTGGELRLQTRGLLIEALATLLKAGEHAGTIRAGLDPVDVLMALGGFALIAGEEQQPALSGRLLDLLFAGLLASPPCGTGDG